ncbi:hypothetical protein [Variovorax sp. JS1663]|uniref:hypothetical protein n=1 Tax=Variovorax sp. JS1663 TaxID=1851577 RepID=UPI000B653370|nr:hypothetical protein [Variovorax sp. JS1663]OUL99252.1 hypothetical protein A8M77_27415 [Variovorax sp. JS1663]
MATDLLRGVAAAVLALFTACPALAQPPRPHLAATSAEELKRIYLDCDRVASRTVLDFAAAAHCSMVGEELKHRVFDGDFDRLIAWWRAQKPRSADAVSGAHTQEDEVRAP